MERLPKELIAYICKFISIIDILNLGTTNKYMYRIINYTQLWKQVYDKTYTPTVNPWKQLCIINKQISNFYIIDDYNRHNDPIVKFCLGTSPNNIQSELTVEVENFKQVCLQLYKIINYINRGNYNTELRLYMGNFYFVVMSSYLYMEQIMEHAVTGKMMDTGSLMLEITPQVKNEMERFVGKIMLESIE